jgi:hypothetical protein
MSRVSPSAVFLPMPSEVTFAEAMSRLRMWFDHKKIQPRDFRLAGGAATGFEIQFQNEREASAFDAGFDWRLPPA